MILVVEDNEDDVFALNWALRRTGVNVPVQIVEDGQAAVDYLAGVGPYHDRSRFPVPNLVLLDLKLPYLTGMEVLAWVRKQVEMAELPVVILTGSDEARDHERATQLGASGYLVKPAAPDDLRRLVESHLQN